MVKVVIAGCGAIARKRHAPACIAYGKERIEIGFFDPVRQSAQSLAEQYGGMVYDRLEDVLQDREVKAVLVCTPEKYHCDTVIACLNAGKHVLCEKPMAMDLDQAVRMAQAQKESRRTLAIAFSQRHYEEYRTAKRLIKEGTIGKVLMFRTCLANSGVEHFVCGNGEDFYDRCLDNVGGVMSNVGCHRVDLISWLLDQQIEQVLAYTPTLDKHFSNGERIPKEDTAMVILKLQDGISGMLWTSWCNYGGADADTQIFGTLGSPRISSQNRIILEKSDGTGTEIVVEKAESQRLGYDVVWDFLDHLTQDKEVCADVCAGVRCMEVMDAIERSNLTGTWASAGQSRPGL